MINLFDGEAKEDLLRRLVGLYDREVDRQAESLRERAIDADFFDGHHFTDDEIKHYDLRGQTALVYNDIKPALLWIMGNERRSRNDWDVKPRSEDDVDRAEVKTKLIKWVDDINNASWERSKAFDDGIKTGAGWTEVYIEEDEWGDLQVKLRHRSWRSILVDACSTRPDLEDADHLFRTSVLNVDYLKTHFPECKSEIEGESADKHTLIDEDRSAMYGHSQREMGGGFTGSSGILTLDNVQYGDGQKALRVIECWYRRDEKVHVLRGTGQLDRVLYDKADPAQQQAIESGDVEVRTARRRQMYVAIFTRHTMLWHSRSPYDHNRFPFVPRLVFTDDRTGCAYGLIRDLRDPQTDLNHRRNKALFMMSTKRVIMDKGAVDDIGRLEEEVGRPDSIIEKKVGSDFRVEENQNLAAGHIDLANQDAAYIRQISGVTGENQGLQTNATSGIAIQARAEQGTIITTLPFDNARLAHQLEGELVLSLLEQFVDRPMQIRISGEDNKPEFLSINDRPETNITATKADFVVAEKEYRTTMRQAMSDQLMALAGNLAAFNPALGLACVELAIDLSDLPNKKDLMARFRKVSGTPDPNDPQAKAAEQQQQQDQQQQAQQQQQMMMQEFAAKIAQMNAITQKHLTDAEREKANTLLQKTQAAQAAIQTAELVEGNPHLVETADDILENLDQILSGKADETHEPPVQDAQVGQHPVLE
jgi:hypothetical protein